MGAWGSKITAGGGRGWTCCVLQCWSRQELRATEAGVTAAKIRWG